MLRQESIHVDPFLFQFRMLLHLRIHIYNTMLVVMLLYIYIYLLSYILCRTEWDGFKSQSCRSVTASAFGMITPYGSTYQEGDCSLEPRDCTSLRCQTLDSLPGRMARPRPFQKRTPLSPIRCHGQAPQMGLNNESEVWDPVLITDSGSASVDLGPATDGPSARSASASRTHWTVREKAKPAKPCRFQDSEQDMRVRKRKLVAHNIEQPNV